MQIVRYIVYLVVVLLLLAAPVIGFVKLGFLGFIGALLLYILLTVVFTGAIGEKFGLRAPSQIRILLFLLILPTLYFACQQPHLPPLAQNFNSPYPPALYRTDLSPAEEFGKDVTVHVVRAPWCFICPQDWLEALLTNPVYKARMDVEYYNIGSENPLIRQAALEGQERLYQRIEAQIRAYGQTDQCRLPPGSPPDKTAIPYIAAENERGAFEVCGVINVSSSDPVDQMLKTYVTSYVPALKAVYGPSAELDWPVLQGKEQRYWLKPTGLIPSYPIYIPLKVLGFKNLETAGGVTPFFIKESVEKAVDRIQIQQDLQFLIVKGAHSSVLVRGPQYSIDRTTGYITAPPGTIFNLWVYDGSTKMWLCPAGSNNCKIPLLKVVVFANEGPIEGYLPISDLDKTTPPQQLAATTEKDLETIPGAPVSAPTAGAQVVQAAPAPTQVPQVSEDKIPQFAWLVTGTRGQIDICSASNGQVNCGQVPSSISGMAKLELETSPYNFGEQGVFGRVVQVVEVQGVTDPSAFVSWSQGLEGRLIPRDNLESAQ